MLQLNTSNFTKPINLVDKIYSLLEGYSQHFQQYFFDNCKVAINYFGEAHPDQTIETWFFDEANPFKLSYKAKDLINHILGLSIKTLDAFSFIRQFNLAKKVDISARWLREVLKPIETLGLLFKRRVKGIQYKITFDLSRSVIEYFEILIKTTFEYYSLTNNSNSGSTSGSSSSSSSTSTSGSQSQNLLAKLLYQRTCNPVKILEAIITPQNQENKGKEKEASYSPATSITSISSTIQSTATPTTILTTSNTTSTGSTTSISNTEPKTEPKQEEKKEPLSTEKKNKGKFDMQIYLDYAKREQDLKKNIINVEKFAEWLLETGEQDKQVARFIEQMKVKNIGIHTGQNQNVDLKVNKSDSLPSSPPSPTEAPATPEAKAELKAQLEIESLAAKAWQTLTKQQQDQLVNQAKSNLLEKEPQLRSQMPKEALSLHVEGLVKRKLGEMLYRANMSDVVELLKQLGKQKYDSLEDYEQFELKETKVEKIDNFYSISVEVQCGLMEGINQEIYLELGMEEMTAL